VSQYAILRSLLSDRPIAFHPHMARVLGGINEALLFQQLAYWSDKGADPEWIYKTQKDIEHETTLSRTQQENARKTLRRLDVISEERRGLPCKAVLSGSTGNRCSPCWKPQTRMRETCIQVRGEPAICRRGRRGPDRGQPPSYYREYVRENYRESVRSFEGPPTAYDEARDVLLPYVADIAREFRDTASVSSTLTRVVRIQRDAGLDDEAFIAQLMRARQITKERTASIRSGEPGRRQQVAYWLATLEDLTKTG
jgi:hypothetical protein